ncbi:Peroxisomal membrane protein MPV17 [Handroanthus impetiginosus]|uniref:Peroxisomal membrane protein MPV17 n=1 Tax=Handroanthus impetiginosus TaxID=429701 RepID=A0A2G9H2C4_9LAMI|nr:Peroxisomal membrane protein MPV17 [Handroanthus impetiginosus]
MRSDFCGSEDLGKTVKRARFCLFAHFVSEVYERTGSARIGLGRGKVERVSRSRTMVASDPATLTQKSYLATSFYSTPTSHSNAQSKILVCNLIHRNWSFACCRNRISLGSANGSKIFGPSEFGPENLGLGSFRVSSGGGTGGGFGGPGDGKSRGGGGSGGGGGEDNNSSLLSWYMSLLAKYPVITKAVTSALLTLVGDIICQVVIDQVPSLDFKRTFTFTLLGLVLVGPTLHFWYLYLSKLISTPGASGALLRLLLDQFLFSPIFIGTFLSTLVTLEGKPSNVIPKLQQEWFSSVVANWQLWIPFQFLNFRFVPLQFQVLAANFIALIWNVILSYKAHKQVVAK